MQSGGTSGTRASCALAYQGLRVGFVAKSDALPANIPQSFLPGAIPTDFADLDFVYSLDSSGRSYTAYFGPLALARECSLDAALESIASSVQHTVAANSRHHVFVHAGVIGWRGKAVLFPGRTLTGKSTLVRALIRAGAEYFSDEFAPVDAQGFVHPFPRPLSLRFPSGKAAIDAASEGARVATEPCRAGAIVITRYRPGARWAPVPISAGTAALELLSNTVGVQLNAAKAVRYVSVLASGAAAIRSLRGDAEDTAATVLQDLDRLAG